tara:strand:+ start:1057 stop:1308 length:252 start_codon:yes stop_codon:yes gene_type:complete
MENYYCKHCGVKYSSIRALTSSTCSRHPSGPNKGKHILYEGTEKKEYSCKFCGTKYSLLTALTSGTCPRYLNGTVKGKHEPAL